MQTILERPSREIRSLVPPSETNNVQLSIARDPHLIRSFRQLVLAEYTLRGWADPSNYPDGVMTDEYDSASDALVIQSEDGVIAGTRIVRDEGRGFPHSEVMRLESLEKWFPDPDVIKLFAHTPRERLAEVTRVVGQKKRRMLTWDIIKCLYWYSKVAQIDIYLMVIDLEFFKLCDTLGVPIRPIGIPVYCEGSWTIPAMTVPGEYPVKISDKNPRFWEYIAHSDNLDATWAIQ